MIFPFFDFVHKIVKLIYKQVDKNKMLCYTCGVRREKYGKIK